MAIGIRNYFLDDVVAVGWQLPVQVPQIVSLDNYSLPPFLPPLTGENSLPPLTGGDQTVKLPLTVSFFFHTLHRVLSYSTLS